MVLLPKQWKSRSSPGFEASEVSRTHSQRYKSRCRHAERRLLCLGAGWSSPVARQAHNLKVAGSNPAPATNSLTGILLGKGGSSLFNKLQPIEVGAVGARGLEPQGEGPKVKHFAVLTWNPCDSL